MFLSDAIAEPYPVPADTGDSLWIFIGIAVIAAISILLILRARKK